MLRWRVQVQELSGWVMAGQSFTGSYLAGSIACNQWEPRPVGCHRPPADDDVELGPVAPADRSPSGLGCVAPVRRVSGCFHGPRRPRIGRNWPDRRGLAPDLAVPSPFLVPVAQAAAPRWCS